MQVMRFLFLTVCCWMLQATWMRAAEVYSSLRMSRRDTVPATDSIKDMWDLEERPEKQLRKVVTEQFYASAPLNVDFDEDSYENEDGTSDDEDESSVYEEESSDDDKDAREDEDTQEEELVDSEETQTNNGFEKDGECVMYINKLASIMMKKNIGTHIIRESDKAQYLRSGWHVVDPAQPGAVRIVCGGEEAHIGLADHCLVWRDGRPSLEKEEDVTAMLASGQYTVVSHKSHPGSQRVSCDNLRGFFIVPSHKKNLATEAGQ
ncbi:hypothetical protein E2C01_016485 [Portunus trituberculatus]|uniref:Uncharacterized protein n=1 Tax=Portunus trituberculatus TaxID=210409 RepID=A0A5B7DR84_PORTR|nr:hypothetical protein [Portunus trituberculatus]